MHHPTDRITHTTAFVSQVVEHWLEREIALLDYTLPVVSGAPLTTLQKPLVLVRQSISGAVPLVGSYTPGKPGRTNADGRYIITNYTHKHQPSNQITTLVIKPTRQHDDRRLIRHNKMYIIVCTLFAPCISCKTTFQ